MGKLTDKAVGKAKQVVAEVTGDGKLAEEGKEQVKSGEKEPALKKPFEDLDKLT
jgi:uncharacterized protein YjbJ (UPF0337 family)